MTEPRSRYPPIADYALISDCHTTALVSREGSIDWCCMPRMDSSSVFGRLLDWEKGGFCSICPVDEQFDHYRAYLGHSMVLTTTFITAGGEARLIDCFTMRRGGREQPRRELLRIVEGVRGRVDFEVSIMPRFDYGEVAPWLHFQAVGVYDAVGGDDGLRIVSDFDLEPNEQRSLVGRFTLRAQEKAHLSIRFVRPEQLEWEPVAKVPIQEFDHRLQETLDWWKRWAGRADLEGPDAPASIRSALTLKALSNAPTGAIAAAATTSLPETPGGSRNWDYRFSWIRDSSFSARSLADMGLDMEADGFRRFIQRSAAGSAHDLQIMYGVGGERRLTEMTLDHLEGYRKSRPVRIGNAASRQLQLDAYGELVDLSWAWHKRGHSPDDDYWRFLVELVDAACDRWKEPDRGIWEIRGEPQHFVHSKVMCWVAVDRGLRLARDSLRKAPEDRWEKAARAMRNAIETKGYDKKRGIFTQAFGKADLDAALLLLPSVGFVDYTDERMVRTVRAVREELDDHGLIQRYKVDQTPDGLGAQKEGSFLACTLWLAECLARQGEVDDAREYFDRVGATSNDVGLFAEEYDTETEEMLGNFPQGLTHLSHIAAALALRDAHSGKGRPLVLKAEVRR